MIYRSADSLFMAMRMSSATTNEEKNAPILIRSYVCDIHDWRFIINGEREGQKVTGATRAWETSIGQKYHSNASFRLPELSAAVILLHVDHWMDQFPFSLLYINQISDN